MTGVTQRVPRIALGLCAALTVALTLPSIAAAAVYYISPTGTSTNSGLSPTTPWSLSKAMSSAIAGDQIRVLPGSYVGNVTPVNHGTPTARISMVGNLANPAAATFSGGLECDRTYWSFKGLKFVGVATFKASSTPNTARFDSLAYCEARGAHFVGSKDNMVYRNRLVNSVIPSGATIAFVFSNWYDWPGPGFNSAAERDTLRGNHIDCGLISWKGFILRVFAQRNIIDSNRVFARFGGANGDVQGRYMYNTYNNTFRDNSWTFEANNALVGSPWNCFSLRDSSSYNLFERDTILAGLQSGFPMYGRLQNAGVAEWNGQTLRNTWRNCIYRMTSYSWVQMNARGMTLENSEFSSTSGPAIIFNGGMKYLSVNHCSFYSATGRAVEFGSIDPTCPPESVRIVNNMFYSKVANSTEGTAAYPTTSGFTSRNNVFYTPSFSTTAGDRAVNWSGRSGSVPTWCSASGKDCNSSGGDPRLVNTSTFANLDLHLSAGSSAIGIAEGGGDAGRYPFGTGGGTDVTPPGTVSSLTVGLISDQIATLQWTAPGDDGANGTATAYDLRYSTSPLTAANFASGIAVPSVPIPVLAGLAQSYVMLGLTPGTTYYFALKARDEAGNWSNMSNAVTTSTQATDQTPPAAVQDLVATP